MRRIWKRVDSQPGALDEYSAEATVNVLTTEGADFGDLVADFGVANLQPGRELLRGLEVSGPGADHDDGDRACGPLEQPRPGRAPVELLLQLHARPASRRPRR